MTTQENGATQHEEGSRAVKKEIDGIMTSTIDLRWDEVYFTNCAMGSANNIDQELGWCKTRFKSMGIDYSYFRSRRETDWYPHYIHNLDNLIRFGGLYPPIQVNADIRRTRLLAAAVLLDHQTFYRDPEDTCRGIRDVDMVPNLSPRNLACIETGKDFMLEHGYIKNDFDVDEWAAPEFLEQAAVGLIQEKWKKTSTEKRPNTSELLAETHRLG